MVNFLNITPTSQQIAMGAQPTKVNSTTWGVLLALGSMKIVVPIEVAAGFKAGIKVAIFHALAKQAQWKQIEKA